jgi:hypothetical protein
LDIAAIAARPRPRAQRSLAASVDITVHYSNVTVILGDDVFLTAHIIFANIKKK